MSLPFSKLTLSPATHEQSREMLRRCWGHWGQAAFKSVEDFMARYDYLTTLEHAKDGRLSYWVLVPVADRTTLDIVSFCFIYRRAAFLVHPDKSEVQDVNAYSMTAVYTPEQYRGKGYAAYLSSLIHWMISPQPSSNFPSDWAPLDPEVLKVGQQYPAAFSGLWSMIGDYYSRCGAFPGDKGWTLADIKHVVWDMASVSSQHFRVDSPEWQFLDDQGVSELSERDAARVRNELAHHASQDPTKTYVAFSPGLGLTSFQYRRFFQPSYQLDPLDLDFQHWGVVSSSDPSTYATWTISQPEPQEPTTLDICRLESTEDKFDDLMRTIFAFAKKHGLATVEVWNLPKNLEERAAKLEGGVVDKLSDGAPALKWYGSIPQDKVEWCFNERYCLC